MYVWRYILLVCEAVSFLCYTQNIGTTPVRNFDSAKLQIPFMEVRKLLLLILLSSFNKYLLINANDR
jgi:hypothetical protein